MSCSKKIRQVRRVSSSGGNQEGNTCTAVINYDNDKDNNNNNSLFCTWLALYSKTLMNLWPSPQKFFELSTDH